MGPMDLLFGIAHIILHALKSDGYCYFIKLITVNTLCKEFKVYSMYILHMYFLNQDLDI